jgi:hypothetical protein
MIDIEYSIFLEDQFEEWQSIERSYTWEKKEWRILSQKKNYQF